MKRDWKGRDWKVWNRVGWYAMGWDRVEREAMGWMGWDGMGWEGGDGLLSKRRPIVECMLLLYTWQVGRGGMEGGVCLRVVVC